MTERQSELKLLVTAAKRGYDRIEPNLIELGNAYTCQMDENIRQSLERRKKSSLFIPATASVVLKIYTSIITAYFSNSDIADISADDNEDKEASEAAQAIQESLRYYSRHKVLPLFPVLSREILNACVYLGCAVRVYWDNSIPRIEGIKLRDLWIDPAATDLTTAQYVVHRQFVPRYRLQSISDMFEYDGDLSVVTASGNASDYNLNQPEAYQLVEILDIYERDGEGNGWTISTMVGEEHILRDKVLLEDGLPIFYGKVIPQIITPLERDAVEWAGASPIEFLLPLQSEINQMRNQQLDAMRYQLEPRYMINKESGLNPFTFYNNRLHMVNDINGVKEFPAPNIAQSTDQIGQLQQEIQDITAVTPYNTGTTGDVGNSTATGTAILTNEANQRLNVYTHSLNETLIEPAMSHLAKLIWRYGQTRWLDNVTLDRATDPDLFVHVNTGLGATNPVVKQNQLQSAIALLSSIGAESGVKELARRVLELMGIKNIQEFIPDEEPQQEQLPPEVQEQMMAQEQMAQGEMPEQMPPDGSGVQVVDIADGAMSEDGLFPLGVQGEFY